MQRNLLAVYWIKLVPRIQCSTTISICSCIHTLIAIIDAIFVHLFIGHHHGKLALNELASCLRKLQAVVGWLAIKQKHLLVCLSHSSTQKRCKSYTVSVVHWTKIWYFTHQHHTYNLIPVWLSICAVLVDLKNGAVYALHDWKEKKVRHEKVFNFFSRLSFCQTFVFHKKHEASACFKRWFKR